MGRPLHRMQQGGGSCDGVPCGFGALLCRLAGVSSSPVSAAAAGSVSERLPCPPRVVAASAVRRDGGSVLGSSIGSEPLPVADPMHGIRCGPAPASALSPCSSDLVGEMQSLAAAIRLNPAHQSPFAWVAPRDPLSEREQRLLAVFLSGDEEAPGPLEQRIFSLEVLPSVSPAAARHRRHCLVKMWWLSWGARYLWLRRFVDLHVLKWEVVWCRLEQQKQLEEVERRAEEARVDLVFRAQRQLTRRKGRHWGLGPSPGPRLSPEWVVWEQSRRVLLGREVRSLVAKRARVAARAVVAGVLAAAAAGVVEKGGASDAQVSPTGRTTASSGGDSLLLAGDRMHRECMGGTGAGSPARQPQPASTEQHNRYSCSFIPAGGLVTSCQDTDTPSTPAAVLPRAA